MYTPTPSVTIGGHFYTYNTLHLTECARIYDIHTKSILTNQYHNGVTQTMALMMAALPLFPDLGRSLSLSCSPRYSPLAAIRKKPLAALCKMVANTSHYKSGAETEGEKAASKNKGKKKKRNNNEDEDVQSLSELALAEHMAYRLRRHANLPSKTAIYKPWSGFEEPEEQGPNFIFNGGTWMDPQEVVDISTVNAYYRPYFRI